MQTGIAENRRTTRSQRDIGALHAFAAVGLAAALVSDDLVLIESVSRRPDSFDPVFHLVGDRVAFNGRGTAERFARVMRLADIEARSETRGWVSDTFPHLAPPELPVLVRILVEPRSHDRAALIIVNDLNRKQEISPELLKGSFGLTPAEATLAAHLINGSTLQEICSRSRVRLSTVRTQLAGCLAKTGTSRQSHLVSLLGKLAIAGEHRSEGLREFPKCASAIG